MYTAGLDGQATCRSQITGGVDVVRYAPTGFLVSQHALIMAVIIKVVKPGVTVSAASANGGVVPSWL